MTKNEERIALFIDCDNISHKAIEGIINELSKYGVVNIRQAYGNWTKENLKNWEEKLLEFAIKPIQQFDYSRQKNATDMLMAIDAMDMLHTKQIDAFALATSDSDFTPLVMRIQAEGIKVFGFGEKKTPKPFIAACSQFIFTENLMSESETAAMSKKEPLPAAQEIYSVRKNGVQLRKDKWLVNLLRTAVEQTSDDYGWANLADVGQYISNKSSFSPLNYGYKKLSHLIKEIGLFDIAYDDVSKLMSIRDKRFKDEV
jgi:uncharacterized protein (TIGR00288 family)